MVRRAAFGDHFYPGHPVELRRELERFLAGESERTASPIGCVAPHAGYIYSGAIAGAVYARLELPHRFLILCPNHTGRGAPLAIMSRGAWRTPLGDALIDARLAAELRRLCPLLEEDAEAHRQEHSLEVQLPFLQQLRPGFAFVPIAVGTDRWEDIEKLGQALAAAVRGADEPVLIVASSDMNHYESDRRTRQKDRRAIDRVLALDPRGLFDTVRRERISMCGYCPTTAMLTAARELGARNAELVRYATSAEVSGDYDQVVGYAGMAVW